MFFWQALLRRHDAVRAGVRTSSDRRPFARDTAATDAWLLPGAISRAVKGHLGGDLLLWIRSPRIAVAKPSSGRLGADACRRPGRSPHDSTSTGSNAARSTAGGKSRMPALRPWSRMLRRHRQLGILAQGVNVAVLGNFLPSASAAQPPTFRF